MDSDWNILKDFLRKEQKNTQEELRITRESNTGIELVQNVHYLMGVEDTLLKIKRIMTKIEEQENLEDS